MSKLFSPSFPTPPPPPPPPSPNSPDPAARAAAAKAQEDAANRERMAKGRASTLLTGGQGDTSAAPTASKVLLGS